MADLKDELFVARVITKCLAFDAQQRIIHSEVDLECVEEISEQKLKVELSSDALWQLLQDVLLFLGTKSSMSIVLPVVLEEVLDLSYQLFIQRLAPIEVGQER